MFLGMEAFAEWVNSDKVGGVAAASALLGASESAIRHWMNGARRPRTDQALAIEVASGGRVPKEDWYWPRQASPSPAANEAA
jgi:DNA-binding transcriptional regulator YdaS (Cro superfamily)